MKLKYFTIIFVLCCCVHFSCYGGSYYYWDDSNKLEKSERKGTEPTKEEVITLLMENIDTPIDKIDYPNSCKNFRNKHTDKQIQTFSEFLAILLIEQTSPKEKNGIKVEWEGPLRDTKNDIIIWHITVTFYNYDINDESPWFCGIDFFMTDSERKIIIETLRCHNIC